MGVAKSKKERLAEQFSGEAATPPLSDADLELRLQGNFLDFKGVHFSNIKHQEPSRYAITRLRPNCVLISGFRYSLDGRIIGDVGDEYAMAYIENNEEIPDVVSDATDVVHALIAAERELAVFERLHKEGNGDEARRHWVVYVHILTALVEYSNRIRPTTTNLPQRKIRYVKAAANSVSYQQINERFKGNAPGLAYNSETL